MKDQKILDCTLGVDKHPGVYSVFKLDQKKIITSVHGCFPSKQLRKSKKNQQIFSKISKIYKGFSVYLGYQSI